MSLSEQARAEILTACEKLLDDYVITGFVLCVEAVDGMSGAATTWCAGSGDPITKDGEAALPYSRIFGILHSTIVEIEEQYRRVKWGEA